MQENPQQTFDNEANTKYKTNVKLNWQKVRKVFQGLKQSKQKEINTQKTISIWKQVDKEKANNKYELIVKKQDMVTESDIANWIKLEKQRNRSKFQEFNLKLVQHSEIVKTCNIFTHQHQHIQIVTYRPIPKIKYLAQQQIGQGHIDTTGVWVWQAEEIMAYYLLRNYQQFVHFNMVLQIGAGCSGLASLAFAKIKCIHNAKQQLLENVKINEQHNKQMIYITDGRADNIAFLHKNITQNFQHHLYGAKIEAQQYIWGQNIPQNQKQKQSLKFEIILVADCIFFQEYHNELINTLQKLLVKEKGFALFINPKRGSSYKHFLERIQIKNKSMNQYKLKCQQFQFEDEKYIQLITHNKHKQNFNPETDTFIFLKVRLVKAVSL